MKQKKNQFRRLLAYALSWVIIFVLSYLYWVVWTGYYAHTIPDPFWNKGNWVVIGVYTVITYAFMKLYGSRNIGDYRVVDIIYSQCLTVTMVNAFDYGIISLLNRWFADIRPIILLTAFDFLCVISWAVVSKYIYSKIYPPRKLLLIYGDHDPDGFIVKMNTRRDKYNINEFICATEHGLDAVKKKILEYESVIICDLPAAERNILVKYCFEKNVRAYVTPKLSDIILLGAESSNTFDTPLLICKNRGIRLEHKVLKRIMDLAIIIPITLLTLPFMLVFALIIKLGDGGDVFYKQKRLTYHGKVFEIYKFRTMKMNSEQGVAQLAKKDDDRITPFGNFLRKTHLDELAQVINILKGDMSIVGPRPERPEIAAEYCKVVPEFNFRLEVKAGLTGYAQVFGKYNTTPYDKLKLDLYYIEHQSFIMDIELILKTLRIMFTKESTEGIDANQVTALDSPFSKNKTEIKIIDDDGKMKVDRIENES
ncbi:MAG: sugar transferase [Clostridia bacterium]|nr:sugar transferase [Clostridia bacterium]